MAYADRGAVLVATLCLALAAPLMGQPLPPRVKQALQSQLKATPENIKKIESGEPVAYLIDTGSPEDVLLVGATRIRATPEFFVKQYMNIAEFEASPSVLATGVFSTPPKLADLKGLALETKEVDALRDCKPGDCDFKIGDAGLAKLRSGVNWKAKDYPEQVNGLVRQLWIDAMNRYMKEGNKALAQYHDKPEIFSAEKGISELMEKTTVLKQAVPDLAAYLHTYPAGKPADTNEFLYWQVGDFGLKPVHRITHVVIGKRKAEHGDAYLIASKMLFASHYFRSALELRFLIPVAVSGDGPQFYLISIQRSYVDGLTGVKGKLIRGTILSKSRSSMEGYMASVKKKVESRYK